MALGIWKSELNEDSSTSIPSLSAYFRYNIGDLNNLLGTCYRLDSITLEIVDENAVEISSQAAMIYKYIYLISFYTRQIRANLGVGGVSQSLSVQSDGGVVRLVDKTQISKLYLQLRKDLIDQLKNLVNRYKFRHDGGNPKQIEGDDVFVSQSSFLYKEEGIRY